MKKMIITFAVIYSLFGFPTMGCEDKGPVEKAGKKIGEALDAAKKSFKRMSGD
jgi:hypothetical protein